MSDSNSTSMSGTEQLMFRKSFRLLLTSLLSIWGMSFHEECLIRCVFPLPLAVTLKSSNEKELHRILFKSENTRRTPTYAGDVPAAFGVWKSPGGSVRRRRTSLLLLQQLLTTVYRQLHYVQLNSYYFSVLPDIFMIKVAVKPGLAVAAISHQSTRLSHRS